jgi:hypothetical protein
VDLRPAYLPAAKERGDDTHRRDLADEPGAGFGQVEIVRCIDCNGARPIESRFSARSASL